MKNFIKQLENEVASLENDYTMHPSTKAKIIKEKKRTINKLRELSYHPKVKGLAEKMMKDGIIESYKVGVGVIVIDGQKEKKDVKLVRGEVYTIEDSVKSLFRYKEPSECNTKRYFSHTNHRIFNDSGYIGYAVKFNLATQEEKAKLIKAEEEHGKFWSDEKGDFLKLEDVYYKAETIQDLKDIIIACPVDLISVGFCFNLYYNLICLDSEIKITSFRELSTNKIKVTKNVFINLLKSNYGRK